MPIETRYEDVTSHDGATFAAFCAIPDGASAPGVLVFQEIFGINDNMRDLATRLAEAGYLALVPDMFWRIEPRFERSDESGMADAMAVVQKFDRQNGVKDIAAAHQHLLGMEACSGKVGAVGFCLGGALTFACAAHSRVDGRGIDAGVAYYGSAINDMLGAVAEVECPMMFHYGERDPFIPAENIDAVEQAVATLPVVEFHRYDAGHAFSNADAPSMYDEAASDLAWQRTLDFLARHLR